MRASLMSTAVVNAKLVHWAGIVMLTTIALRILFVVNKVPARVSNFMGALSISSVHYHLPFTEPSYYNETIVVMYQYTFTGVSPSGWTSRASSKCLLLDRSATRIL